MSGCSAAVPPDSRLFSPPLLVKCVDSHRTSLALNYEYEGGSVTALKSPQRNFCSWASLISQHIKSGRAREALRVYQEIRRSGAQRSSFIFVAVLKACSSLQDLGSGKQIHAELVEDGFESDIYVGTMLLDMYAKCGCLVSSRSVFDKMPHRNVVSWNAMILGYAQQNKGDQSLQLYAQLQNEGVVPNNRTFVGALKACSSLAGLEVGDQTADGKTVKNRCLQHIRAIHSDILNSVYVPDVYVWNILLDVYAKCGSLADARQVFKNMPQKNVVSWNAMIMGHAIMEDGEGALKLYDQMQTEGVVPDDRTFVGTLKGCSILADGNNHSLGQVRSIHSRAVKYGFESDIFVGTMLVDVYAKCGSLVDARHVFEKMRRRDVISWTAMIWGYAQMEEGREALLLYARMQQEGITPNDQTLFGALKACGCVAALDRGKEVHAQILNLSELQATNLYLARSLIDMYSKCGSMADAQHVFDGLPTKDVAAWTALIAGYARTGESQVVFDLFESMRQEGMRPNGITFLTILTVCSHAGLVDEGRKHFDSMTRDCGLSPTVDHYTCMVDLLGRSGQLNEAMAMVKSMPFQPDSVMWRTLLGACRKWMNVDIGRQAFEGAIAVDSRDTAAYVMMSNIYEAANMMVAAGGVRAMRGKTQAWKQPGQSQWTDNEGMVHIFAVGESKHPCSGHVFATLEGLRVTFRDEQVHATSHFDLLLLETCDDGLALCGHSSNLEAAYAKLDGLSIAASLPSKNSLRVRRYRPMRKKEPPYRAGLGARSPKYITHSCQRGKECWVSQPARYGPPRSTNFR